MPKKRDYFARAEGQSNFGARQETPAMLVKSDGATTYLLRDLATLNIGRNVAACYYLWWSGPNFLFSPAFRLLRTGCARQKP